MTEVVKQLKLMMVLKRLWSVWRQIVLVPFLYWRIVIGLPELCANKKSLAKDKAHKTVCKLQLQAAKLRDKMLFKVKDPLAKEDCPICFLPIPTKLICYILLPPATISSVPTINNFAIANEELAEDIIHVMPCCRKRKNICRGCVHVKKETWSVHFAILILTEVAKQLRMVLKRLW